MNMLNGVRVITNEALTEAGAPVQGRRPWTERLFTIPWRPLRATKTVVPQVPMKGGYQLADGTLVLHPAMLRILKDQLNG